MGSNAAEHHPISFKWILRAKENGAKIMHVDPKFSRTSAKSDFHVPLRSGTDIAFLGGLIKYIIEGRFHLWNQSSPECSQLQQGQKGHGKSRLGLFRRSTPYRIN